MLGFKRKNNVKNENEQSVSLIEKKTSFFSKILAFFRRKKSEEFFVSKTFYTLHSYGINGKNNLGEKIYDATVKLNENDSFNFIRINEIGNINHKDGRTTKIIIADYETANNPKDIKPDSYRKICFEIPNNYSLEDFLYNDGLYELVRYSKLKIENLNYYEVTPIGQVKIGVKSSGKNKIYIVANTEDAITYAKVFLTPDWLVQMKKDKIKLEEIKRKEDMDRLYYMPQTSLAFQKEPEKQENRINDNNIRITPRKKGIYFTDPCNGKTVYLSELKKVNSVIYDNDNITNLYVTNYTAKKEYSDIDNSDVEQQLAFELTDDDMNELLKNDDESLNYAFRTLFSEKNIEQYKDSDELGNRHIGYLKKTLEGYKILIGCKNCKNFLNSLKNLSKYNRLEHSEKPISVSKDNNE